MASTSSSQSTELSGTGPGHIHVPDTDSVTPDHGWPKVRTQSKETETYNYRRRHSDPLAPHRGLRSRSCRATLLMEDGFCLLNGKACSSTPSTQSLLEQPSNRPPSIEYLVTTATRCSPSDAQKCRSQRLHRHAASTETSNGCLGTTDDGTDFHPALSVDRPLQLPHRSEAVVPEQPFILTGLLGRIKTYHTHTRFAYQWVPALRCRK